MSAQFDDVLNKCIEEIIAQRQTVESCLEQYPELAGSLRPLLQLASLVSTATLEEPDPSYRALTKTRFLAAAETKYKKRQSRGLFAYGQRAFAMPLAPLAAMVVFLVIAASGSVMASADSLPDEPLYPVKRAVERVQLVLSFGDDSKADRYLQMASRRLNEMTALSEEHGKLDTDVVRSMGQSTDKAIDHLERVAPKSVPVEEVEDLVTREETVLRAVADKAPKDAQPSLEQALAASARGHRWANLVQQKIDGMPQSNLLPNAESPTAAREGEEDAGTATVGSTGTPFVRDGDSKRGDDKVNSKGRDGDGHAVGSPLSTSTSTAIRATLSPEPTDGDQRDDDDDGGQARANTPTPAKNEDEKPGRTPTPTARDEHPTIAPTPNGAHDGDDERDDKKPVPTPTIVPSGPTTPVLSSPTKAPTVQAREVDEQDGKQKATPVPTRINADQGVAGKRTPTPTPTRDRD